MSSNDVTTPGSLTLTLKRPRSKDGQTNREKKAKRNTICPICDETIKEPTKHRKGDDAIYCEGYCEAWIHRKCAGLSNTNFTVLSNAGDSHTYFCLYCELQAQKAEIDNLMETITQLQTSLSELKRKLESSQQTQTTSKSIPSSTTAIVLNSAQSSLNQSNAEKKFNIVVYGIPESPKNTNRQLRIKKDMENVIEALLKTDNEIQSADIKDLYRLGKYDPENERPRPLLIKLLRSNMVFDILSSKTKLEAPIYIKPDMTYQERQKERILLKERRSLIDQGTERRHIKIRSDSIFVNNKFYCKVSSDGTKLEHACEPVKSASNTTARMESS